MQSSLFEEHFSILSEGKSISLMVGEKQQNRTNIFRTWNIINTKIRKRNLPFILFKGEKESVFNFDSKVYHVIQVQLKLLWVQQAFTY